MEKMPRYRAGIVVAFVFVVVSSVFHSSAEMAQISRIKDRELEARDMSVLQDFSTTTTVSPLAIQISRSTAQTSPFLLSKNGSLHKPVTRLNLEHKCTPDSQQPLQTIMGVYENYSNISQALHLPTTIDESRALVCLFQTNQGFFKHFAHAMQQLYGCYSFYQEYPLSKRKILVMRPSIQKELSINPFLLGFFRFLQDELSVEILDPNAVQEVGNSISPAETYAQGGYFLSHAAELNRQIQTFLSLPEDREVHCGDDDSSGPRIGILNRRPAVGRSIQNVDEVVEALNNLSCNKSISVEYFEGSSFADQVEFFRGIDILLSPHGAQNTGIPFMSNKKCSHLVELFPKNYLLPTFYGSLARNAGIGYSYLYYVSATKDESRTKEEGLTLVDRVQARAASFCLAPGAIRDAVASVVEDWRACRQRP